MLNNISVIGSGSWATALVKVFADSKIHVSWLVRGKEQADYINANRRNPRYLSYAEIDPDFVQPTTDLQTAIEGAQLIIFAMPSAYLKGTVESIDPVWLHNKQLAVSIKSFVPDTGYIPSLFVAKYFEWTDPVIVLSGPCHAEEIAMEKHTYLTIAGSDPQRIKEIGESLRAPYIQVVYNNDPSGVQYAAILKNIIGIATGIADGLHYGENFLAVLSSNAMREINAFLSEAYGAVRDLHDSAYFGDLLVTAYSGHSRNRTLGKLIGRGMQVTKALGSMKMVAEGYYASRELAAVTRQMGLSLPIINSIYRILHEHANPFHEFKLVEKLLR
jgi:glycerol-3-phosphate dehydrogenase (NAD(P)+)